MAAATLFHQTVFHSYTNSSVLHIKTQKMSHITIITIIITRTILDQEKSSTAHTISRKSQFPTAITNTMKVADLWITNITLHNHIVPISIQQSSLKSSVKTLKIIIQLIMRITIQIPMAKDTYISTLPMILNTSEKIITISILHSMSVHLNIPTLHTVSILQSPIIHHIMNFQSMNELNSLITMINTTRKRSMITIPKNPTTMELIISLQKVTYVLIQLPVIMKQVVVTKHIELLIIILNLRLITTHEWTHGDRKNIMLKRLINITMRLNIQEGINTMIASIHTILKSMKYIVLCTIHMK